MSKTAEEIINDVIAVRVMNLDTNSLYQDEVKKCMIRFAAQEVEVYKERVFKDMKNLVARSTPSDWEIGWNSAIAASIQTIKQTK